MDEETEQKQNSGLASEFLTKKQIAAMLHRSERTVEDLVKRGVLPCIKLSERTVLFDAVSVRAALLARQVGGVR
jgi:hypothetical protein